MKKIIVVAIVVIAGLACFLIGQAFIEKKNGKDQSPSYNSSLTSNTFGDLPANGPIGDSGKPQMYDVFSGEAVNRHVYVDFNSERIYFCCDKSQNLFNNNPTLYYDLIKKKGIILQKVR